MLGKRSRELLKRCAEILSVFAIIVFVASPWALYLAGRNYHLGMTKIFEAPLTAFIALTFMVSSPFAMAGICWLTFKFSYKIQDEDISNGKVMRRTLFYGAIVMIPMIVAPIMMLDTSR